MKEVAQLAYELFGVQLNAKQLAALERYEKELLTWNAKYNLTAIREPAQIRSKHFLDSISSALALRGSTCRKIVDVGTGAGFPGIPLKIIMPEIQLTLVDSVEKKIMFCRHIVETLQLKGVQCIKARAEEPGRMTQHREQYDWACGRAVAVLPVLLEYLLPLVSVGGHVLAMKGESAAAEVQQSDYASRLLGGRLRQLIPVTLPGVVEQHYLVVIDKVAATVPTYPRRVGVPAKHPLLEKALT